MSQRNHRLPSNSVPLQEFTATTVMLQNPDELCMEYVTKNSLQNGYGLNLQDMIQRRVVSSSLVLLRGKRYTKYFKGFISETRFLINLLYRKELCELASRLILESERFHFGEKKSNLKNRETGENEKGESN